MVRGSGCVAPNGLESPIQLHRQLHAKTSTTSPRLTCESPGPPDRPPIWPPSLPAPPADKGLSAKFARLVSLRPKPGCFALRRRVFEGIAMPSERMIAMRTQELADMIDRLNAEHDAGRLSG